MGCDIHAYAETRQPDGSWQKVGEVFPLDEWAAEYYKKTHNDEFFDVRHYGVFGFLADVRNYSAVPPLREPKGLPSDLSDAVQRAVERWYGDGHSHSWFSLRELLAVDYDQTVWDRRYTRETGPNSYDGGATAEPHQTDLGQQEPLRDFLGAHFMRHLDVLKTLGAPDDVRIVFWFDN